MADVIIQTREASHLLHCSIATARTYIRRRALIAFRQHVWPYAYQINRRDVLNYEKPQRGRAMAAPEPQRLRSLPLFDGLSY